MSFEQMPPLVPPRRGRHNRRRPFTSTDPGLLGFLSPIDVATSGSRVATSVLVATQHGVPKID